MSLTGTLSLPLGGDAFIVPVAQTFKLSNAAAAAAVGRSPALDPITGDLVVSGGQMQLVSGIAYVGQLIRSRLLLFKGEYVPDTTQGMPWLQSILVKGANPNSVRGYFSDMILGTPGVQSIKTLTVAYNTVVRSMAVTLVAQTNLGLLTDQFLIPLTPDPQGIL